MTKREWREGRYWNTRDYWVTFFEVRLRRRSLYILIDHYFLIVVRSHTTNRIENETFATIWIYSKCFGKSTKERNHIMLKFLIFQFFAKRKNVVKMNKPVFDFDFNMIWYLILFCFRNSCVTLRPNHVKPNSNDQQINVVKKIALVEGQNYCNEYFLIFYDF